MESTEPVGRAYDAGAGERVRDVRLAVNTQTPLVRLNDVGLPEGARLQLDRLEEGNHYKFTTGGVTRMLHPLLRRWIDKGSLQAAEWVCLGVDEASPILQDGALTMSFVGLDDEARHGYAQVKERMWELLNAGPDAPTTQRPPLEEESWIAFDTYQERTAARLQESSERMGGIDLLYVHDFQQVGVADAWRGRRVPRVFHLHTPFPSVMPERWRDYFTARFSRYDAIIVSTPRYASNLRDAGLEMPLHVIPPFVDPEDYPLASSGEIQAFRDEYGIGDDERVVLNVGRMDPIKGQDRLIRAMPFLLDAVPEARLVLVGNGSFSSSRKGGLGLSKGGQWRAHLETLARELGVSKRVTFTGHISNRTIPAAFGASTVFALPSTREGFGLAAIEAWRYRKPVLVCDRAGVSDLVIDGVNGHVADCVDADALAKPLAHMLRDPDDAKAMGIAGFDASHEATLPMGGKRLESVFARLLEEGVHVLR